MRRISAGAAVHNGNGHYLGLLILGAVHRLELFPVRPLGKGNRADIVGKVRVLLRIPVKKLLGEPVGRLRLAIHDHLLIFVFFRRQIIRGFLPACRLLCSGVIFRLFRFLQIALIGFLGLGLRIWRCGFLGLLAGRQPKNHGPCHEPGNCPAQRQA